MNKTKRCKRLSLSNRGNFTIALNRFLHRGKAEASRRELVNLITRISSNGSRTNFYLIDETQPRTEYVSTTAAEKKGHGVLAHGPAFIWLALLQTECHHAVTQCRPKGTMATSGDDHILLAIAAHIGRWRGLPASRQFSLPKDFARVDVVSTNEVVSRGIVENHSRLSSLDLEPESLKAESALLDVRSLDWVHALKS